MTDATGPGAPGTRSLSWVRLAIVVGAAVLGVVACSAAPAPSATAALPASPIDGVVVKVDSTSIGDVRGFTLRVAGGATLTMTLGTLENATQFAPGHLAEHQATASPIRAYFVLSNGTPIVYRLEDAPTGTSASP